MANERKFIAENVRRVLLKEYLMKEVSRAGFGGLDVQRTPLGTRVTLITERPGIVIGRRGAAIKNLTRAIEEDFKFDNPQVEVQEVANPNLNAQIMAEKLAFALERGWHFRRAGHSTIRRVMDSGARGCHIIIAGKLTGQRHRTEKFKEGYIKFCGEPKLKDVDKGYAVAKLKPGVIGVTVEIMRPGSRLPDEIDVISPAEASEKFPELAPLMIKKEEPSVIVPNEERAENAVPVEASIENVEGEQ
jgi:small subunit ribosomal protein S3